MTPPANRYGAALSTYFMRPGFRVLAIFAAVDWLILLATGLAVGGTRQGFDLEGFLGAVVELILIIALMGPYILFVVFVALMMQHLREQLTARAAMVPGFLHPHVIVGFGALVLIPVVGMIAFLISVHLLEPAGPLFPRLGGMFSLLMFALAVTAWMASLKSPWLALLMLPLTLLSFSFPPAQDFYKVLMNEAPSPRVWQNLMPAILLVLDVLILAGLLARLNHLSRVDTNGTRRRPRLRMRSLTVSPIQLRPHRALSSPLLRAWHRRAGVLSPAAPWIVTLSLGSLLLVVAYIYGGEPSDLLRSVLLPTVVPGVVISLIWRERWMNLGYESLYPADREQFLQELLAATAISLGELWLATAVAVLPPILIYSPHLLRSPIFLVTLLASAAMQVMVFGIMFLSALFRPMLPYINVVTILAQLIPISFAWADNPELSQRGLLIVAVIEMLIGIVVTTFGYSGWRKTDLA